MKRDLSAALLVVSLVGCGETGGLPAPARTDEALDEGRVLPLPIEGEWPRLGLQWTYEVQATGFPATETFPRRIAYRVTTRDDMGHPWSGWWMYGNGRGISKTGATIRPDRVFFHPPRQDEFEFLRYAPFPEATPGRPGQAESVMTLGEGHGELEGTVIRTVVRDVGWRRDEGPTGSFDRAWRVEGEVPATKDAPGWRATFAWVDRVGWTSMEWTGAGDRRLALRLVAVRDVRRGEDGRSP